MSRWLLLAGSLALFGALAREEPTHRSGTGLGGSCVNSRDCQAGLRCVQRARMMNGQCTTECNATTYCQEQFGTESLCVGVDLCARTCTESTQCPSGSACNDYGWCERR